MLMTAMALAGVLFSYSGGSEIGRERWTDDGKNLHSEVVFAGVQSVITLSRSPRRAVVDIGGKTITRDVPPGAIALENGNWQAYALAAEQFPDARVPTPVKVLVPSSGALLDGILTVTARPDKTRHLELTIGKITVAVDLSVTGTVTHAAVPLQQLDVSIERLLPAKRAVPAGVVEERIEIVRVGVRVRGVLWRPTTQPTKKADRLPVVLFIAGSGPTDRDGNNGFGLATDCYRLLAETLARAGIASVRFDKRGIGASDWVAEPELVVDDYVGDASALITSLRSDRRLGKVSVIGHSEGALIALLLAQRVSLDGLVLLAGPGRPLWQGLHDQLARQFDTAKLAELDQILFALRDGKPVKSYPSDLAAVFRPSIEKFLRSELPLDPASLMSKLKIPVTIVQGETDMQVTTDDAKRLAAANKDAHLVLLPRVNHVLKEEAERSLPQASYSDLTRPLGPGVADAVLKGVVR